MALALLSSRLGKEAGAATVLWAGDGMAALDTIARELDALQTEEERVLTWRRESLLGAGYDQRLSLKLALRPDVDLHLAVRLGRAGCPPETAARILL
jgi:hypothetical protein